jgi:uncharacterized protein (DUF1697 family)
MAELETYVAFLRGINVARNKMIKMAELKGVFESLKFRNVKTLLASGNVLFETAKTSTPTLADTIQGKLKDTFGFDVGVTLRTVEQIRALASLDPFKNIVVTPQTRLYVTFLPGRPSKDFKTPFESPTGDYQILRIVDDTVFSVLTLTPSYKTNELMVMLDKTFGKKVTTRNWNTIAKILEASK